MKITLRTITPVHVGSGIMLYKNDFIQNQENHSFKRVAISQFLDKMDDQTLAVFLEQIKTGQLCLNDFVKDYPSLDKVKGKYLLENPYQVNLSDKNEIKEHIKSGTQVPYIPGSSVKGAIRTALLWEFSKKDKLISNIEQSLKKKSNITKKTIGIDYVNDIFNISGADTKWDATKDFMKYIEVSDFLPSGSNELLLIPVTVYSSLSNTTRSYDKAYIFCECVTGSFQGTISVSPQLAIDIESGNKHLDAFLKDSSGSENIERMMDLIKRSLRNYLRACISKGNYLQKNEDIMTDNLTMNLIRIGSEIGTTYQTLIGFIECSDPALILEIINSYDLRGLKWNRYQSILRPMNRVNPPYPKSFKYSDDARCSLGWCEILTDQTPS